MGYCLYHNRGKRPWLSQLLLRSDILLFIHHWNNHIVNPDVSEAEKHKPHTIQGSKCPLLRTVRV